MRQGAEGPSGGRQREQPYSLRAVLLAFFAGAALALLCAPALLACSAAAAPRAPALAPPAPLAQQHSQPPCYDHATMAPLATLEALRAAGEGVMAVHVPPWVFASAAALRGAAEALGPPPSPPESVYVMGRFTHAQFGEDVYAYEHFFFGKRDGVILESGALDGNQFSTSWFFVKALGWRAVHVEPSPTNYGSLSYQRPEALNVHTALCNESRSVRFITQQNSVSAVGGIWEFMTPEQRLRWFGELSPEAVQALPTIPCQPLQPLLAMFHIAHVDLWVLDVEGAEASVLSAVDLGRLSVDVIVVESDGTWPDKDAAVQGMLKDRGYLLHHHADKNDWWLRKGFAPVARH
jgi:FkbM family methyltransferase